MECWKKGIMGKCKIDAETRRIGDAEKDDLFLPISVSFYHPVRIFASIFHYSIIPVFRH